MADPLQVVSFCDRNYLTLLENFLAAPGAPDGEDMLIYALDEVALKQANSMGVDARLLQWSGDLAELWTARVGVFAELVLSGVSFIHTDLDAVWLRDPRSHLFESDHELVFSQGTIHPREAFDAVGFVLCCGLFMMRAGPVAAKFCELLKDDLEETGDDQASVNRLLSNLGTVWPGHKSPHYRIQFQDAKFSCWSQPLDGICDELGLRIRLLAHKDVMRVHDPIAEDPFVYHPLSPKDAGEKMEMFENLGLRFI